MRLCRLRGGLGLATALLFSLSVGPVSAQSAPAPKAYIGLFKDSAVAVLDTASNKVLRTIPVAAGPHGLVVTPDGRWVYVSSDGDSVVSVIDTRSDQVVASIEVGPTPHGLAITPDGSRVLVAGFGTNSVKAIDTTSNAVVWQVDVAQPHNLAITADGQTAYVGSQKEGAQALAIIDLSSAGQIGGISLDHSPRALSLSADGADLAYTLAGVDALQIEDVGSQQLEVQIPTGASPHHPLFTADGKLGMVVSQGPGTLDLFDPATYATLGAIKVGTMPHWIGLTADSRWAYVTNELSNDLSVVDLSERTVKATVAVGNAPRKIVIQPATMAPMLAASSANVAIASFAFSPPAITVNAGESVTFTNNDAVVHTSTSTMWDSAELQPGQSFTTTLLQPGTYSYHCTLHPFMTGAVTVH